jgi:hypothetical protein
MNQKKSKILRKACSLIIAHDKVDLSVREAHNVAKVMYASLSKPEKERVNVSFLAAVACRKALGEIEHKKLFKIKPIRVTPGSRSKYQPKGKRNDQ